MYTALVILTELPSLICEGETNTTPISYATHLNEAVVADNKLASCSFPSRQAFPFPHQVIAYGNGLDVRSTRQVQPWHLGPASFAGTPTARIGLGRASASADNNPSPFALARRCQTQIQNNPSPPESVAAGCARRKMIIKKTPREKTKYPNAPQVLNCVYTSHEATLVAGTTRTHDVMIEHIPAHYRKT